MVPYPALAGGTGLARALRQLGRLGAIGRPSIACFRIRGGKTAVTGSAHPQRESLGPELIFVIDPAIVTRVSGHGDGPVGSTTTLLLPHFRGDARRRLNHNRHSGLEIDAHLGVFGMTLAKHFGHGHR